MSSLAARIAAISPKPKTTAVPASVVSVGTIFTMYGDSLTAGNLAGAGNSITDLLAPYVTGVVANEGIGSQTSGQIADRVTNVDPTINTAGKTRAELNAGRVWLEMGRNNTSSAIGTTGIISTIMSDYSRSVAAITGVYAVIPPLNANIEPYGDPAWAQCKSLARKLAVTYPNLVIDWRSLLQALSDMSATDKQNLLNDEMPTSTMAPGNSLHPGYKGNAALSWDCAWRYNNALSGGAAFVNPFEEKHLTGTDASTAQSNGGAVGTVTIYGTPTTVRLASGNITDFQINNSGAITRRTGTVLTAPFYEWIIEATTGNVISRGVYRVYIGASDTSCSDTTFDGRCFMVQPDAPSGFNSQKMSGFCAFSTAAGTDGQSMYLIGNENFGRFTIERNVNNRFRVIAKDNSAAPGTSVAVLQSSSSGAGLVTNSAGLVWVFWSFDINAGTPVSKLYVNETSAQAAAVLTQGATVFLDNRMIVAAQSQSNANPFKGTLRALWVANDYIDWSVGARRAEAYVSATKAAVALGSDGAINSIVPFLWMPGNSADRGWGYNRGTGGDFVTALLPGTAFA